VITRPPQPISFSRGRHLFQIAPAPAGEFGFVGYRDGRLVARASERREVARTLMGLETAPRKIERGVGPVISHCTATTVSDVAPP
jgi:hypothetical protein